MIVALVPRDHFRNFGRHLLRARNVLLGNVLPAQPFLQMQPDDPERENIPELRLCGHSAHVLQIEWCDLLPEEGGLIHKDHLVRGDQNEIVCPVDVGSDKIEKDEDKPEEEEDPDDPHQRSTEVTRHNADDKQQHREYDLPQDCEEEREAVIVGQQDLLLPLGEEPLLDIVHIGLKGEDAHGRILHRKRINRFAEHPLISTLRLRCSFCAIRPHRLTVSPAPFLSDKNLGRHRLTVRTQGSHP